MSAKTGGGKVRRRNYLGEMSEGNMTTARCAMTPQLPAASSRSFPAGSRHVAACDYGPWPTVASAVDRGRNNDRTITTIIYRRRRWKKIY